MKSRLVAASSFLAISVGAFGLPAMAQTQQSAPAEAEPPKDTEVEAVVTTGSFIRGKPEDAPQPVTAITLEDLRDIGTPTAMDLIKTLTESGAVAGEFNRYLGSTPPGAASVNLRSLGQGRTVVLFNNRRLVDQRTGGGPASGRFNNINVIPQAAIGRVEVLRDGGAVTYGADAVGGVVNYITRKLNGAELNANYRYISDSDGDWDVSGLWGRKGDDWNITLAADYQHRSPLRAWDRDFTHVPVPLNNTGFVASTVGNPGSFRIETSNAYTGAAATASGFTVIGPTSTGINQLTASANRPSIGPGSTVNGILRDPSCVALGGFASWSSSLPVCYNSISQYDWLVEEQNTAHLFGEFNKELTERIRFHADATFYYQQLPNIHYYPSDQPVTFPIHPTAQGGFNERGWFATGANPAVAHLANTLKNADGTNTFSAAQIAAITDPTNPGRIKIISGFYKLLGNGGDPRFLDADGTEGYTSNSRMYRLTLGLAGDLPEMAGLNMDWDLAVTASRSTLRYDGADVLTNRVQAAFNGYGGPNCPDGDYLNAQTRDTVATPNPANRGNIAAGCYYLNPFGSAVERNIWQPEFVNTVSYVGTGTYAGYVPGKGLTNNPDVIDWLYAPIWMNRQTDFLVADAQLNGQTSYELPGGPIAFATGAQFRIVKESYEIPDIADSALNPCPSPGLTNTALCPGQLTRPLAYNRIATTMGISCQCRDPDREFPVYALFGEVALPITRRLNVNIASRWEKFMADRVSVNQEIFVPSVALKYQMNDVLAFRATYGKTFRQVDPPLADATPGGVIAPSVSLATYGNNIVLAQTATRNNVNIRPETGFNYNAGLIFNHGGAQVTVDYWAVQIDDYVRNVTADQIGAGLALNPNGVYNASTLIDPNSPLLQNNAELGVPIVQVAPGCLSLPNPTVASCLTVTGAATQPGVITFFSTVNSGSFKTAGVDVNGSLTLPGEILGGKVRLSTGASVILKYELDALRLAGVQLAPSFKGIGSYNEAAGKNGQHVSQWRANWGFNYSIGRHNLNWNTHYVSSMVNDNASIFTAVTNVNPGDANGVVQSCTYNPNVGPPFPTNAGTAMYGAQGNCNYINQAGMKMPGAFNTDVSYRLQIDKSARLQITVQNLFAIDPNFSRNALSYDSTVASPLGRTIRVGLSKTW